MTTTTEAPPEEKPAVIIGKTPIGETTLTPMMKSKRTGVTIATPLRDFDVSRPEEELNRQVPQIGRALKELRGREDAQGYEWTFMAACGGLCSAQNRMIHEFLQTEDKWLLRWDADLHEQNGKEADAILRLISQKLPIVGGLYCKRAKRPQWVATFMPAAKLQADGLLQCAELGGGFKLCHRKFFEETRRIFGTDVLADSESKRPSIMYRERESGELIAGFHQIVVSDGDLLSEDYFLDYLARSAGVGIFADTLVRMKHADEDWEFPDGDNTKSPRLVNKFYPEGAWPPIQAEDAP